MKIETPYYLIDENKLLKNLKKIKRVKEISGAKSLLALKCFSTWAVFDLMSRYMDGTTSSSLFEAKLGYEEFGKEVHAYSVAYSDEDIGELKKISNKIIFNSISQLERFCDKVHPVRNHTTRFIEKRDQISQNSQSQNISNGINVLGMRSVIQKRGYELLSASFGYLNTVKKESWIEMKRFVQGMGKCKYGVIGIFLLYGRWKNKDQLDSVNIKKYAEKFIETIREKFLKRLYRFNSEGKEPVSSNLLLVGVKLLKVISPRRGDFFYFQEA
jgi:hypothetical protein